jgi:hypothetical protein
MTTSQVRIFPHNVEDEFPSEDLLRMWLLNGLRGRGGEYHLRNKDAVADLPPGSIVLFRWGNAIVGEAVVWKQKEVFPQKKKDRTLLGKEQEYEAQVTFAPSSIRLYAPPLPVKLIQPHTGKDLTFAGACTVLDWDVYARILEEVVKAGALVS